MKKEFLYKDDEMLKSTDARDLSRLIRKHGSREVDRRWEFLREMEETDDDDGGGGDDDKEEE